MSFKSKRKLSWGKLGFVGLGLVGVGLGLWLVKRQQEIRSSASWGVSQTVGKYKSEMICQLTGKAGGTGANVRGTDLGFVVEHNGKTYFFFGDTNTKAAEPDNVLSNVLAYTTDKNPQNCLSLNFITARDLFPTAADFYAKESNIQAEEEVRTGEEIYEYIFSDYDGHKTWGSQQSVEVLKGELNRKQRIILDFYAARSKEELADYYARTVKRLNSWGFAYRDADDALTYARDFADRDLHKGWAEDEATVDQLWGELAVRTDKIFDLISSGVAKQVIPSKIFSGEVTTIPTGGISINGKMYVYYMSIKEWSTPWKTHFSGLAVSDNDGASFKRMDNMFSGNGNFAQIFPVLNPEDNYVYLFGIKAGREGGLRLARVKPEGIEDKSAYEFCLSYGDKCKWVGQEILAGDIVPAPVGEVSVVFDGKQWMLSYLNYASNRLEARLAKEPWGKWGGPMELLACTGEYHGCYGALTGSQLLVRGVNEFYYVTSFWDKYNSFLMKAVRVNEVQEPGIVSVDKDEDDGTEPTSLPTAKPGTEIVEPTPTTEPASPFGRLLLRVR